MKATRILLLGIIALLYAFQAQAQQEIIIMLYVDTREVRNPNVNDYCSFAQPAEIPNEEYTVEASVGDTIIWKGVSRTHPEDRVLITAINHQGDKGGRDIFGQNRIPGENGEVRGTILNDPGDGLDYKYMLSFRVLNNGDPRPGEFNIDPKIRVR